MLFKTSLFQALVEAGRLPTLELILNDQFQKFEITEAATSGLFEAHIEGVEDTREP
jgi:hypothetical protein